MTDRALANAEKVRDELADKINKTNQRLELMRKELASVEKFISDWHRFADSDLDSGQDSNWKTSYPQAGINSAPLDGVWVPLPPPFPLPPPPGTPPRKNPDKAEVGKVAKVIIYAAQKPVPRTELFQALAERGIRIHGKDPEMVLSTMMWRMKEDFVRLPHHGYWIKSLPWKAAKNEPGIDPQQDIEDLEIELNALETGDAE